MFSRNKKIDDSLKKALDLIDEISPIDNKAVGDILVNSGLITDETYVLVYDSKLYILMRESLTKEEEESNCKTIFNFVGKVEQLIRNSEVIISRSGNGSNWVYGSGCDTFTSGQLPMVFKVGEGIELRKDKEGFSLTKENNTYREIELDPSLSQYLLSLFPCTIYPTSSYKAFVERKYQTETQFSLRLAGRSNILACCAFVVSIIGVVGSVFISNYWGHTTLEKRQYHELIETIKSKPLPNFKCNFDGKCKNSQKEKLDTVSEPMKETKGQTKSAKPNSKRKKSN